MIIQKNQPTKKEKRQNDMGKSESQRIFVIPLICNERQNPIKNAEKRGDNSQIRMRKHQHENE
jgi:hypothetical protein